MWASGKVILFGEHAVVHGYPAVVGSLDRGVTVTLKPGKGQINLGSWGPNVTLESSNIVAVAANAVLAMAGAGTAWDIDVDSSLLAQAGMGSSAAFSVALARAAFRVCHKTADTESIEEVAMAGEEIFHGTPSGVDVVAAARGGFLSFYDGVAKPLARKPFDLAIGIAGPKPPTSDMVAAVTDKVQHSDAAAAALAEIGKIADTAIEGKEPWAALMNNTEEPMRRLGLVCPDARRLMEVARQVGASGTKVSGAGGGGAVIAMGPANDIVESWSSAGYEAFVAEVGVPHE